MQEAEKTVICSRFEITRLSLKTALEHPEDSICCERLEDCHSILEKTPVSFIILDIDEQENVLDHIRKLHSTFPAAKICVIAKTLLTSLFQEIKNLGIEHCLMKPVYQDEILAALK